MKAAFVDGPPAPVPPAVVSRDEDGLVTIRAIRLTERLVLDGRLDDRLYRESPPFGDFIQQEPREGQPATEKTEVWVAYDEDAIYIGARLWESDSSKRVMSDMRRDANNLYNNDHLAVMLDTSGSSSSRVNSSSASARRAGRRASIPRSRRSFSAAASASRMAGSCPSLAEDAC